MKEIQDHCYIRHDVKCQVLSGDISPKCATQQVLSNVLEAGPQNEQKKKDHQQ